MKKKWRYLANPKNINERKEKQTNVISSNLCHTNKTAMGDLQRWYLFTSFYKRGKERVQEKYNCDESYNNEKIFDVFLYTHVKIS